MTIKEALAHISSKLSPTDGRGVGQTPVWILEWIMGISSAELIARSHQELNKQELNLLESVLQQLIEEHKPLQYILGSVTFLNVQITVRPPMLIPRPETEYWCDWLIKQLKKHGLSEGNKFTFLDMCTGSGCIALALAKTFPESTVWAIDISKEACELAQENALKNGVTNVKVVQSDLFAELPPALACSFDLIVSNPPYVSAEEWAMLEPTVKAWEDPHALKAEERGFGIIKRIINDARRWLKPSQLVRDGIPQIVIEIGHTQGQEVQKLFEHAGYINCIVHKDQAGKDRFVTYAVGSKGAAAYAAGGQGQWWP